MITDFNVIRDSLVSDKKIPSALFSNLQSYGDTELREVIKDVTEIDIKASFAKDIDRKFRDIDTSGKNIKIIYDLPRLCDFFFALYEPLNVDEDSSNRIYLWRKTHYVLTKDDFIKNFFYTHCVDSKEKSIPRQKINEFCEMIKIRRSPQSFVELKEQTRFKMNFLDCVFDVKTKNIVVDQTKRRLFFTDVIPYNFLYNYDEQEELNKHAKKFNIRYDANYNPKELVAWKQLLSTVIPDFNKAQHASELLEKKTVKNETEYNIDAKRQRVLLEWFIGYTLSQCATINNQYFLLLIGKGANGKSFFLETVKKMLGEENCSYANIDTFAKDKFSLQILENKSANFADDTDKDIFGDMVGKFKELIGGNSKIQIERKFENARSAVIYAKFFISSNHVPYIPDADFGFLRRMLVVNFKENLKLVDKDYLLKDDDLGNKECFKYEWEYIIKKCLDTYRKSAAPELPDSVKAAISMVKSSSDNLTSFLNNYLHCTGDKTNLIPLNVIHELFKTKYKNKISTQTFTQKLNEYIQDKKESLLAKDLYEESLHVGIKNVEQSARVGILKSFDHDVVYVWDKRNTCLNGLWGNEGQYNFRHYDTLLTGFMFREQYLDLTKNYGLNKIIKNEVI